MNTAIIVVLCAVSLLTAAIISPTNVTVGDQPQVVLDLSIDSPDGKTVRTQLKTVIPIVHIPPSSRARRSKSSS